MQHTQPKNELKPKRACSDLTAILPSDAAFFDLITDAICSGQC